MSSNCIIDIFQTIRPDVVEKVQMYK